MPMWSRIGLDALKSFPQRLGSAVKLFFFSDDEEELSLPPPFRPLNALVTELRSRSGARALYLNCIYNLRFTADGKVKPIDRDELVKQLTGWADEVLFKRRLSIWDYFYGLRWLDNWASTEKDPTLHALLEKVRADFFIVEAEIRSNLKSGKTNKSDISIKHRWNFSNNLFTGLVIFQRLLPLVSASPSAGSDNKTDHQNEEEEAVNTPLFPQNPHPPEGLVQKVSEVFDAAMPQWLYDRNTQEHLSVDFPVESRDDIFTTDDIQLIHASQLDKIEELYLESFQHKNSGEWSKAITSLKSAIQLAEDKEYELSEKTQIILQVKLAELFSLNGQSEQALEAYKKAQELVDRYTLNKYEIIVDVQRKKEQIDNLIGQNRLTDALQLSSDIVNQLNREQREVQSTFNLFRSPENTDDFNIGIATFTYLRAGTYYDLGFDLMRMGKYREAYEHYRHCLSDYRQLSDQSSHALEVNQTIVEQRLTLVPGQIDVLEYVLDEKNTVAWCEEHPEEIKGCFIDRHRQATSEWFTKYYEGSDGVIGHINIDLLRKDRDVVLDDKEFNRIVDELKSGLVELTANPAGKVTAFQRPLILCKQALQLLPKDPFFNYPRSYFYMARSDMQFQKILLEARPNFPTPEDEEKVLIQFNVWSYFEVLQSKLNAVKLTKEDRLLRNKLRELVHSMETASWINMSIPPIYLLDYSMAQQLLGAHEYSLKAFHLMVQMTPDNQKLPSQIDTVYKIFINGNVNPLLERMDALTLSQVDEMFRLSDLLISILADLEKREIPVFDNWLFVSHHKRAIAYVAKKEYEKAYQDFELGLRYVSSNEFELIGNNGIQNIEQYFSSKTREKISLYMDYYNAAKAAKDYSKAMVVADAALIEYPDNEYFLRESAQFSGNVEKNHEKSWNIFSELGWGDILFLATLGGFSARFFLSIYKGKGWLIDKIKWEENKIEAISNQCKCLLELVCAEFKMALELSGIVITMEIKDSMSIPEEQFSHERWVLSENEKQAVLNTLIQAFQKLGYTVTLLESQAITLMLSDDCQMPETANYQKEAKLIIPTVWKNSETKQKLEWQRNIAKLTTVIEECERTYLLDDERVQNQREHFIDSKQKFLELAKSYAEKLTVIDALELPIADEDDQKIQDNVHEMSIIKHKRKSSISDVIQAVSNFRIRLDGHLNSSEALKAEDNKLKGLLRRAKETLTSDVLMKNEQEVNGLYLTIQENLSSLTSMYKIAIRDGDELTQLEKTILEDAIMATIKDSENQGFFENKMIRQKDLCREFYTTQKINRWGTFFERLPVRKAEKTPPLMEQQQNGISHKSMKPTPGVAPDRKEADHVRNIQNWLKVEADLLKQLRLDVTVIGDYYKNLLQAEDEACLKDVIKYSCALRRNLLRFFELIRKPAFLENLDLPKPMVGRLKRALNPLRHFLMHAQISVADENLEELAQSVTDSGLSKIIMNLLKLASNHYNKSKDIIKSVRTLSGQFQKAIPFLENVSVLQIWRDEHNPIHQRDATIIAKRFIILLDNFECLTSDPGDREKLKDPSDLICNTLEMLYCDFGELYQWLWLKNNRPKFNGNNLDECRLFNAVRSNKWVAQFLENCKMKVRDKLGHEESEYHVGDSVADEPFSVEVVVRDEDFNGLTLSLLSGGLHEEFRGIIKTFLLSQFADSSDSSSQLTEDSEDYNPPAQVGVPGF